MTKCSSFNMIRMYAKYMSLIALTYIFTICLIYTCIPMLTFGTTDGRLVNVSSDSERVIERVTVDVYRLNWQDKEKVFFKKIKVEAEPQEEEKAVDLDLDPDDCVNSNYRNRFISLGHGAFVYSAYPDNRTAVPMVRMIAAVHKNMNNSLKDKLWCHFEIPSLEKYTTWSSSKATFYEMCENHKKSVGGWILSCVMPSSVVSIAIPAFVKVGFGDTRIDSLQNSKTICVKSRDKTVTRRQLDFGVCVPPLYGNVRAKTVIEFIELNRLLGADVFMFYIDQSEKIVPNEVLATLRHYEAVNVVKMLPWQLPVPSNRIWYHGQSLAINDCLYRNMFDFHHLVFVDLDEFLIPHGDLLTWNDILHTLQNTQKSNFSNASGFRFKSAFFGEEFSKRVYSNEMATVVRANRTEQFSFVRNKVVVRPFRILELGIHHVSRSWPDSANYSVIKVDPAIAHVHHYRDCVQEFGLHCKSVIEDFTVAEKYGKELSNNYLKTLHDIIP